MKKNKFLLGISLLISIVFLTVQHSCEEKKECPSGYPIYDSYFTFRLVDQYGINQIAAWGSRYISDSVFLTKIDGTLPNQLEILGDGNITFFIPDSFDEARDTFITRQFLLYLPDAQGHPNDDIDTLRFKYRFNIACYENFEVFYNDSLYHNGQYIDIISFTKN